MKHERDPSYLDLHALAHAIDEHLDPPFKLVFPTQDRPYIGVIHPEHGACGILVDQRVAIHDDPTGGFHGAVDTIHMAEQVKEAAEGFAARYPIEGRVVGFVWGTNSLGGEDLPYFHPGGDHVRVASKIMDFLRRKGRLHA